ncbi:hypothetical protein [Clostridium estertheticum]|uniref:hypothetical protein n=1 Tax=Clostridium estertheticum TaxID=238834 RepID=UPI001CF48234|nr:hypothetical protein [Clostridium estertheticum]MCB2357207.1 hypothetical protein [Clostridium estertheticum]WAG39682.1 hypothetical protein LL065_15510 [Clostridium estertheticum]
MLIIKKIFRVEDLFLNHSIIIDDAEMRRYSSVWKRFKIFNASILGYIQKTSETAMNLIIAVSLVFL